MAIKYALFDGDFHSSGANSIWYSASATTAPANGIQVEPPTISDVAVANGKTITITQDVNCLELTNSLQYGWNNFGGGFIADTTPNNLNIKANIRGTQDSSTLYGTLTSAGTNTLNLSGIIYVPPSSTLNRNTGTVVGYSVWHRMSSSGILNVYGDIDWSITGASSSWDNYGGYGIVTASSAVLNVYGIVGVGKASSSYYNNYSCCIVLSNNSNLNVYGSVGHQLLTYAGGRRNRFIYVNSNCTINVYGEVNRTNSDATGKGFQVNGSSNTITVNGNVYQPWAGSCTNFHFETAGSTNNVLVINGNLIAVSGGVTNYCIYSDSSSPTNTITVNGNVYSSYAPAIYLLGANLNVNGNVIGGASWPTIMVSDSGTGIVTINGNILDSINKGVPAIYAPFLKIKSTAYQPYLLCPSDPAISNQPQTDEVYYYPLNSFSQFSLPAVSSVREGVTFANGLLTGTCTIPAVSNVYYGVLFDSNQSSMGTATVNPVNLFDINVSAYDNNPNSLGYRLANAATTDEFGHLLGSLG